jgi:hypothetical protein
MNKLAKPSWDEIINIQECPICKYKLLIISYENLELGYTCATGCWSNISTQFILFQVIYYNNNYYRIGIRKNINIDNKEYFYRLNNHEINIPKENFKFFDNSISIYDFLNKIKILFTFQ